MRIWHRVQPLVDRVAADRKRSLALMVIMALIASGFVVAAVVESRDELEAGEARLVPEGNVEISLDGAEFASATSETTLEPNDRVRVLGGSAVLELPDGAAAELRTGSNVRIGEPEESALALERGDLLVQVRRDTLEVDGGSATATVGAGAVKMRRSASFLVGAYEGSALIAGRGQSLSVPALRQAAVAGIGTLPESEVPLDIDDDDEWDRRFLAGALDLDRRLVAFGRGFEAVLPETASVTPALYRLLLPGLGDVSLTAEMLGGRSAGENLIGLVLVALDEAGFEDAYESIFGLREQGARWGLVAIDRGLESPAVVGTVEAAIDRAPVEVAGPEPTPPEDGDQAAPPPVTGPSPTGPPTSPGPSEPTTTTEPDGNDGGSTTTTAQPGPGLTLPTLVPTTTTTAPTTTTTTAPTTTTTQPPPPNDCLLGLLCL